MKKQTILKIIALLTCTTILLCFTGCNEEPIKATGYYQGQTITMKYSKKTDRLYPDDMAFIEFQNGIAIFFDYGTKDEQIESLTYDQWNAMDKNGNILFEEPYGELSRFNQEGFAVAKKSTNDNYVLVNTQGEEVETYTKEQANSFIAALDSKQTLPGVTVQANGEKFETTSTIYNGLEVYVQKTGAETYNLGLADEQGSVIIPANIPITFRPENYRLTMNEDAVIINDNGKIGIVTIQRS